MYSHFLDHFWPAIVLTIALAIAGGTRLVASQRSWRAIAATAALLAVVAEVPFLRAAMRSPTANFLTRDAIAWLLLGAGAILLTALVATKASAAHWRGVERAGASMLAGLFLLAIAPYVLLFVHCTSGDCI